jgi:pimeloyl-ACP methyl ester carboxylesterase
MTQQSFRIPASGSRPSLFIRRQPLAGGPAVLYVHGATFPSALSVGFDFGGGSWLDDFNARGFDAWAFDFAGFGESGRYAELAEPADRHPPLCRTPEAAEQVAAVLALMRRETGQPRASLVAHSWGSMPAARAAIAEPDGVDRLVLFAPIARRSTGVAPAVLPAWNDVTTEAQHARFVADVPKGHPPVLSPLIAGRRPILRVTPKRPGARRPPCAFPTARAPTMPTPGRAGWPGTRLSFYSLSPSCAAPGIRSAPTAMQPCWWRRRPRRRGVATASSRRAPI